MKRVVIILALLAFGLTIPSVLYAEESRSPVSDQRRAPTVVKAPETESEPQEHKIADYGILTRLLRSITQTVNSIFIDETQDLNRDDLIDDDDKPFLDPPPDPPVVYADNPDLDEDPLEELK